MPRSKYSPEFRAMVSQEYAILDSCDRHPVAYVVSSRNGTIHVQRWTLH